MKAVIAGGGIIGLSTAFYLNESGWEVTVVDQGDLTDNCSYGNMGMIVPSHFVPLAAPGMVSKGIRWMLDSRSPFYVRPSLSPALIGWGLKFIKSANKDHVSRSARSLKDLNLLSRQLYEEWSAWPGFDFALENKGIIMYYRSEKTAEEEVHLAGQAREMGLDAVVLNKDELQKLEPDALPDVLGGVHYRCDAHLYPNKLMEQLKAVLATRGTHFITGTCVTGFIKEKERITSVKTSGGELKADIVVMANGSWLPRLATMAGLSIPLMPGKGYSITQKSPQTLLNIPAILCEARVAITPMGGQMRYGGTMEIGSITNNQVNMKRVQGIIRSVPSYFQNLKVAMPKKNEVWYGFRPCSPDGLPYIGRSPEIGNLYIGGGHAMMGLSLGPATGKVIAELVNGHTPSVDLSLFQPGRFS